MAAACALAGLLVAVVLVVVPPSFDTGDDPMMAMIVSARGLPIEPDEHLVFSHVRIGQALKELYLRMPTVPWYGLYLLTVQYLALVGLLYAALRWNRTPRSLLLLACYLLTAGLYFISTLQFTTTAFVAAQSAALLWWCICSRCDDRTSWRSIVALVAGISVLFAIAAAVRPQMFWLTIALASPGATLLVWQHRSRRAVASLVFVPILTVATAMALDRDNARHYSNDPMWRAYLQYNERRAPFNDYGWMAWTEETAPIFTEAGWSRNDHDMLLHWFYADTQVYSGKRLKRVLNARNWATPRYSWNYLARTWRELLWDNTLAWGCLAALPITCLFARSDIVRQGVWWITAIGCLATLLAISIFIKPPPPRVAIPLFCFPLACGIGLATRPGERVSNSAADAGRRWPLIEFSWFDQSSEHRRVLCRTGPATVAIACIAALASAVDAQHQWQKAWNRCAERTLLQQSLSDLNPPSERLYVCWSSSFPLSLVGPFDATPFPENFRIYPLGWLQHSPLDYAIRERFNCLHVAKGLFQLPQTNLISDSRLLPMYCRYVKEHYELDVECQLQFETPLFSVYKPRSLEEGELHARSRQTSAR